MTKSPEELVQMIIELLDTMKIIAQDRETKKLYPVRNWNLNQKVLMAKDPDSKKLSSYTFDEVNFLIENGDKQYIPLPVDMNDFASSFQLATTKSPYHEGKSFHTVKLVCDHCKESFWQFKSEENSAACPHCGHSTNTNQVNPNLHTSSAKLILDYVTGRLGILGENAR